MVRETTKRLAEYLQLGDFEQAIAIVRKSRGKLERELRRLPREKPERMKAAAAIAEVLFYQGRGDEARRLIVDAAARETWLQLNDAVPPRARLQLVEHDYSLRDFTLAKQSARRIQHQCNGVDDHLGAAEAVYYFARCAMRQHRTTDVFDACRDSLEYLAAAQKEIERKAPASPKALQALQWRIGMILLVSGFTASKAGHASAWADLWGAKALLAHTRDVVGRANADMAIGATLRSRSTPQAALQALAAFRGALDVYQAVDHKLNIARVRTHLGRTFLNLKQWTDAKKEFAAALDAVKVVGDDAPRSRQRAECLVWLAWLHRWSEMPSVANAMKYARKAEEELSAFHSVSGAAAGEISVEVDIVLGECLQAAGETGEAREKLQRAAAVASQRSIEKLRANSCLSLAALEASTGNLGPAFEHYTTAVQLLTKDSSAFLLRKAQQVKDQIEARNNKLWLITEKDLLSQGGLLRALASLERWGVARVEARLGDKSHAKKAQIVGLETGQGYSKLLQRVGNVATVMLELPPVPGSV